MRPIRTSLLLALACAMSSPVLSGGGGFTDAPIPPRRNPSAADLAVIDAVSNRLGMSFVTIGHTGNRGMTEYELGEPYYAVNPYHSPNRGRVDYSYRMMHGAVSNEQWSEFLNLFTPFWLQFQNTPGAVENGQLFDLGSPGIGLGASSWEVAEGFENTTALANFRNAMRYANWLHHGAPTENLTMETFHTGAYRFSDDFLTDSFFGQPVSREEGARFFIPTIDEWFKALYYDPNRNGEGEEGYWRYANGSDTAPIPGVEFPDGSGADGIRLGAFPGEETPLGMQDAMHFIRSWTETPTLAAEGLEYYQQWERVTSGAPTVMPGFFRENQWTPLGIIRIGAAIPSPASGGVLLLGVAATALRRR
jgi:hypothetical protein